MKKSHIKEGIQFVYKGIDRKFSRCDEMAKKKKVLKRYGKKKSGKKIIQEIENVLEDEDKEVEIEILEIESVE
jgi:hypothetical protein